MELTEIFRAYEKDRSPALVDLRLGASRIVPGEGPIGAPVAFVGEAPGRTEAACGRPFAGAAGRLLAHLMWEAGLQRHECYVTNVVKYRPPENRDPEPDEIEASVPYLRDELAMVRPRVVVPTGRFALDVLCPGLGSISSKHGKVFRNKGWIFFPVYHPAVGLYNRNMIPSMEADFRRLGELLKEEAA